MHFLDLRINILDPSSTIHLQEFTMFCLLKCWLACAFSQTWFFSYSNCYSIYFSKGTLFFPFSPYNFLYIYIFSSLFISICTFFFLVNCKNICNELKIYLSQTFTVHFPLSGLSYVSSKIINWTQLWNKISNISHLKYHKILSLTNVFLMCFHVHQCCFTSNASLTWWCISLYPL